MNYKILITETARNDLRQIVNWWSQNRSIQQAEAWYDKIFPAIQTLTNHPERCPVANEYDLLDGALRQLHFGVSRKTTHRIVFTISNGTVVILRVRHIAQDSLSPDDLNPPKN